MTYISTGVESRLHCLLFLARYESVGRPLRRLECQDVCKQRLHDRGEGRHMSPSGRVFVALLHA